MRRRLQSDPINSYSEEVDGTVAGLAKKLKRPGRLHLITVVKAMNTLSQESVSYRTVRIDNLDIFYREAGPTNAPVLLLLHGVPSSSRMYQPMLESSFNRSTRGK